MPAAPLDVSFPERASLAHLRAQREFLRAAGRLPEALRVAERLTRLAPGRESAWRLGVIQRESGNYREALKTFRDALRYRTGPAYVLPEIHLHAACSWYLLKNYKRMGECLGRAYRLRPKARTDASLHWAFGAHHMSRKAYAEARREFEKAEAAAAAPLVRARCLRAQAVAAYFLGELAEASRILDAALRIHKHGGRAKERADLQSLRGAFYLDRGRYGLARAIHLRAARVLGRLGVKHGEALARLDAGYAAVMLEDWEEARGLLDQVLRFLDAGDDRRARIMAHALRAQACARLGAFAEASEDLRQAQAGAKGFRDYVAGAHVYRAQARIAELFGDWPGMRRWARRAERGALREGDRPRIAEFRALRARAEEKLGRRRAAQHARRALEGMALPAGRGVSSARRTAARLAKTELPLLLTGEVGTGKTDLAREIHAASARRKGPCVVVACETLRMAAAELNGHVEGAWTGAGPGGEGWARKAAGGTLVLDRADEMEAEAQRILVPIVEGRVRPLGAVREERVDVRVIGTCRRPERLIPELRRRLEGARIELPPLRERAEDVPALVRAMLGSRARITEDALALLARQRWEGNLGELRSFVERMASTAGGVLGLQAVRARLPRCSGRRRKPHFFSSAR